MQRPTSLTIIGWILIVFGGWGLVGQLALPFVPEAQAMLAESSLPASVHMVFGIISALVSMASGYGILKGLNWSRYLYIGWNILAVVFSLATLPFTYIHIVTVAMIALIASFLFRAPANAWFTERTAPAGE